MLPPQLDLSCWGAGAIMRRITSLLILLLASNFILFAKELQSPQFEPGFKFLLIIHSWVGWDLHELKNILFFFSKEPSVRILGESILIRVTVKSMYFIYSLIIALFLLLHQALPMCKWKAPRAHLSRWTSLEPSPPGLRLACQRSMLLGTCIR